MAIVPLLLIKMKVMIAIRMRGIFLPPIVKAKTSLGSGQGTVVDIRTVIYESRKQLKIKVSLKRKIHIMALPQVALLNARWSEAQSAAKPCNPPGRAATSNVSGSADSINCSPEVVRAAFLRTAYMNLPSENTAKPRNEALVQYNWAGKEKKA